MRLTTELYYAGQVVLTDIHEVYPMMHQTTHHKIDITHLIVESARKAVKHAYPDEHAPTILDDLPAVG